jgi:hypothetical protein
MRHVLLGIALTLLTSLVSPGEALKGQATRLGASDPPTARGIHSETHDYVVALQERQTLHLVVNHTGADPVIVVRAPGGGVITEMDTPDGANGSKSLWIVASATGDHTISVRARGVARAGSGEYVLRVEALRETTPEDRKRLEMQNAWFAAFRLLDEGPRRYAAAGERLKETITAARALKDDVMATAASTRLVRLDPKAALDTLELKFVPGATPLYYSSGHEQRAISIRDRLRPAIDFFESKLQVKVQVHVAVLAREDWTRLLTRPLYGMPWPVLAPGDPATSSPRVGLVGMPATTELTKGPVAALQKPGVLSPDIAAAVKATGLSFEEGMRLWSDETMYHELGHIYTIAYGIEVDGWLNEFLAQFFTVAYDAEAAPPAGPVRAFSDALRHFTLHTYKPKRVALEDIQHGASAYPADYAWYQYQFLVRAEDVYKAQGMAFLARVKDAFPPGDGPLSVDETLARLEKISPGSVEWARNLARPGGQKQPIAPVRPVVGVHFGTKVTDPYRYMENAADPEVRAWMKAQADHTASVLGRIAFAAGRARTGSCPAVRRSSPRGR